MSSGETTGMFKGHSKQTESRFWLGVATCNSIMLKVCTGGCLGLWTTGKLRESGWRIAGRGEGKTGKVRQYLWPLQWTLPHPARRSPYLSVRALTAPAGDDAFHGLTHQKPTITGGHTSGSEKTDSLSLLEFQQPCRNLQQILKTWTPGKCSQKVIQFTFHKCIKFF